MAEIRFHPEAQEEYEAALAWYQARNPQAAARFEAEMERVLGLMGDSPEMCPEYDDDFRFAVLRRYPYSVVFQVLPTHLYVIAVAHGARATGYWHDRT